MNTPRLLLLGLLAFGGLGEASADSSMLDSPLPAPELSEGLRALLQEHHQIANVQLSPQIAINEGGAKEQRFGRLHLNCENHHVVGITVTSHLPSVNAVVLAIDGPEYMPYERVTPEVVGTYQFSTGFGGLLSTRLSLPHRNGAPTPVRVWAFLKSGSEVFGQVQYVHCRIAQ